MWIIWSARFAIILEHSDGLECLSNEFRAEECTVFINILTITVFKGKRLLSGQLLVRQLVRQLIDFSKECFDFFAHLVTSLEVDFSIYAFSIKLTRANHLSKTIPVAASDTGLHCAINIEDGIRRRFKSDYHSNMVEVTLWKSPCNISTCILCFK